MINTYTSYNLIARDIDKSLGRVEKQPIVARDTKYFQDNIGNIKTVEEFVDDTRLFNYAMKAFGLEDMAYAKAFMKKALTEGVSDPNSFANKLSDKRYAEFVKAFNFEAFGETTTTYNAARDATVGAYTKRVTLDGLIPLSETHQKNNDDFMANIGDAKSIDDLLDDSKLLAYALYAFELEGLGLSRTELEKLLIGGVENPESPANKHANENVARFVTAFNFAAHGESTTTRVAMQADTMSRYMRQTLEQNAGADNEGVRLALYFERKAPEITSFYSILGDPALAKVVRTILGLPESVAQADVDRQVRMMERRLDIEDFKDPEALQKMVRRFTTMWEINNPTTSPLTAATILFSQPPQFGISVDTMMAIALMKK